MKKKDKKAKLTILLKEATDKLIKASTEDALTMINLVFEEKLIPKEERKYYKKIYAQILEMEKELESNLRLERKEKTLIQNRSSHHLISMISKLEKFTE